MVRHSWQAPRLVFCPLGPRQCGSTHADRPGNDQYARERQHGGQYRTIRVVIAMDQVQDCTLQVQCVLLLAAFRSCTRYSREFHSMKVRSPGRKDTSPQLTIPYQKKLRPIPPFVPVSTPANGQAKATKFTFARDRCRSCLASLPVRRIDPPTASEHP
jgi:hypothetical protein